MQNNTKSYHIVYPTKMIANISAIQLAATEL